MDKIKDFFAENRLALLLGLLLLLLICWLHKDNHRNDTIHHDTDRNVVELEKRIESAESRLDGMSKRLEQNQKTIESVGRGISTSTGLAVEIVEGTDRAEKRLESAVGRSEKIQRIIDDIETKNR